MYFPRLRVAMLFALGISLLTSCQSPAKREEAEKKMEKAQEEADQMQDPMFRSFISRLRKAIANRDVHMMSSMMSDKFAYSWAPGGEGYGCFQYWDQNSLWPELEKVVNQQFLPSGTFYCAPPEFVQMGQAYTGFRAGIHREKGTLKFAYFVPAEEMPMAKPPAAGN